MNWALEDRWVSREMGLNFKKAGGVIQLKIY